MSEAQLRSISGVGEEVEKKLARLGVNNIHDLLQFYPRKYDDYSKISKVSELKIGQASIKAKLVSVKASHRRRSLHITEAHFEDETGSISVVWFNQRWLSKQLKNASEYFISGELSFQYGRYSIVNPAIELAGDINLQTARIVPVYPETKGLSSKQISKIVLKVLDKSHELEEDLPSWLTKDLNLPSKAETVKTLHLPESSKMLNHAQYRESFTEVFALSLAGQINKKAEEVLRSYKIPFAEKTVIESVKDLNFKLTDAQKKVLWKVIKDCNSSSPMNRMVEGDVGSGKTVVAAMAALNAISHGLQVALIAPTEILVKQHLESMKELLGDASIELLVGSTKASEKKRIKESLANGETQFVIGTHAVIQPDVSFNKLGLIVIDEQHRFGVDQRQVLLKQNNDYTPHVLTMTATPIPRSLALTLYGELSLSVINEMPPGRKPVITELVSPNSRKQMYAKIHQEIAKGRQAFIVYPLINDSDSLEAKSIERDIEGIQKEFKADKVVALHGKMSATEKDDVMTKFMNKEFNVLVGTTVIEVGVNIPNASVIVIEGAERFGLAQLHQLRGRVARSSHQSYCYVVPSQSLKPPKRLQEFERTTDGFALAEYDLKERGPGAIYGKRQSGTLEVDLTTLSDSELLEKSQLAAEKFIKNGEKLIQYPRLERLVNIYSKITKLN